MDTLLRGKTRPRAIAPRLHRQDTEQPKIQNGGMKYEGLRFRAECRLAGRLYGQTFGVDVAFGDPILGEPDAITVDDVLGFAGIAPK